MKHWTPRIAEAAEAALATGADDGRRARARAALLAALDRRLPASSSRRRSPAGPSSSSSRAGTRARLRRAARRPGARHRRARRLHRAQPAGADPRRGRPVPGAAAGDARQLSRRRAGLRDWSFSYQSESPTGEPWLGPDILDHLDALHARGRRRRPRLPGRLRRRPPRDPLGPRHRGAGEGGTSSACASPGSRCRTPTRPSSPRSRRIVPAGARGTLDRMRPGEIRVDRASRRFRVHPQPVRTLKELRPRPRPAPRRPRSGRSATSRSRSSPARRSA